MDGLKGFPEAINAVFPEIANQVHDAGLHQRLAERAVILKTLNSLHFADATPYTAWARLLDEGTYQSH